MIYTVPTFCVLLAHMLQCTHTPLPCTGPMFMQLKVTPIMLNIVVQLQVTTKVFVSHIVGIQLDSVMSVGAFILPSM